MILKNFNSLNKPPLEEKRNIVGFMFNHLEKFSDPRADIEKAIDYSLQEYSSFGGFVLIAKNDKEIIDAVVVNQTGMKDYIPENILVYIAIHEDHRGIGVGKQILKRSIELPEGDIVLHVEPDNPAKFLYEKVGFTSKYIEMRYKKGE
ncbi:GNAT family N-acetyltransferase [bacterium]|nr:GNAT family N-acetyltransferase [bacterium]